MLQPRLPSQSSPTSPRHARRGTEPPYLQSSRMQSFCQAGGARQAAASPGCAAAQALCAGRAAAPARSPAQERGGGGRPPVTGASISYRQSPGRPPAAEPHKLQPKPRQSPAGALWRRQHHQPQVPRLLPSPAGQTGRCAPRPRPRCRSAGAQLLACLQEPSRRSCAAFPRAGLCLQNRAASRNSLHIPADTQGGRGSNERGSA